MQEEARLDTQRTDWTGRGAAAPQTMLLVQSLLQGTAQLEVVPMEESKRHRRQELGGTQPGWPERGPVQLLQPVWLARQEYVLGRSRSRLQQG